MALSFKDCDIFPPFADPKDSRNTFNGSHLLEHYSKFECLSLSPKTFKQVYDLICFLRSSFAIDGYREININKSLSRASGIPLGTIRTALPASFYNDEYSAIKLPLELLPRDYNL